MALPAIRRSLWAVAAVAIVALSLLVAVPYVASTRIVRERIAVEMSRWSGYRVEIGSPVTIQVFPRLRAVLDNVTFLEWSDDRREPVATAQRIDVELSPLAAMQGDAVFSSAVVTRPTLLLSKDADRIGLPAIAGKGRLRYVIDRARDMVESGEQSTLEFPSDAFGIIRIENGEIRQENGPKPVVTEISGVIDWPTLNGAGSFAASGMWAGQSVRINAQSDSPLTLIAGGTAAMRFSIEGDAGTANYEGNAKLTAPVFFNGKSSVTTKSFAKLMKVAGTTAFDWTKLQAASFNGDVVGDTQRLKFDHVSLDLDGYRATGAIEVALNTVRPVLSGSLAFATIGIDDLFGPLLSAAGTGTRATALPIDFDVRLSVAEATAAGMTFNDAAAAIQMRNALFSFDLLDASTLGGTVQGAWHIENKGDLIKADLNLAIADVDGSALGGALGMTRLVPAGRGSVSLAVSGEGADTLSALQKGDGQVWAKFGPSTLGKFDLAAFLDLCRKGGFFSLDQSANGDLQVDGVDLKATLTDGLARIDKAEALVGERRVWISGVTSSADHGLALTGGVGPAITETSSAVAAKDEANFFVGGSWAAPYISPVLQSQAIE